MTREEAIKLFEKQLTAAQVVLDSGFGSNQRENNILYRRRKEMAEIALSALRPVSRERVERMRGEWMFKPFYKGTSRGAIECQECKGAFEGSVEFNFCPNCGAPMTDEAVQMVMERLEALKDGSTTD